MVKNMQPIVVLAGGVGAARFLEGVVAALPVRDLTIIGNIGDDTEIAGLHVSPDLDTVLYTLTGESDEERGWGVRGLWFGLSAGLISISFAMAFAWSRRSRSLRRELGGATGELPAADMGHR